jgi:hypothetical protein
MPTVPIVDGVRIVFYANEHPPAHFHAVIAEHRAVVDIVGAKIIAGSLSASKRVKVLFGPRGVGTRCSSVSLLRSRTRRWSRSNEEAAFHR